MRLSSGKRSQTWPAPKKESFCKRLKGDNLLRFAGAARALRPAECAAVLAHLRGEKFQDRSPAVICVTLLDEGEYPTRQEVFLRLTRAFRRAKAFSALCP